MAICTSGGGIGNAEFTFNRIMKKKGIEVVKFLSAPMIDNSMPILLGGAVNRVDIDEDKIVDRFINMTYKNQSTFNSIHKATELAVYNPLVRKLLTKKVMEDQCVACGKCESICPNDNIQIVDGTAVINKHCTECFGCVHICPKQAIYVRKPIGKTSQYINKNIDINDMN
jgi:ferredoxin